MDEGAADCSTDGTCEEGDSGPIDSGGGGGGVRIDVPLEQQTREAIQQLSISKTRQKHEREMFSLTGLGGAPPFAELLLAKLRRVPLFLC